MGKIKFIDVVILLAVILAFGIGYLTYKHFRQTGEGQIESTAKIAFQVFLRGVTITGTVNPIKVGEETFISIRNVPYTNLKIVDVQADKKKTLMENPAKTPPFLIVDDYSQLFMYDIIVTVIDTAKITKDGAVVGGNKIKIGLPITLEGKDYKFNGTVSSIQILDNAQQPTAGTAKPQQPNATPQSKGGIQPATKTEPKAPIKTTVPNGIKK